MARDGWAEKSATRKGLIDNDTWDLVPPPNGVNIVGSKWVLKVKRDASGELGLK